MHRAVRWSQRIAYASLLVCALVYGRPERLDDLRGPLLALAVVATVLGFAPPLIARYQRVYLEQIAEEKAAMVTARLEERIDRLQQALADGTATALRHAHETGVYDGVLRRSLQWDDDRPRPRRLQAVPRDREGA